MATYSTTANRFFYVLLIVVLLVLPNILFSQNTITGKIMYQNDNAPAAYANIELNSRSASAMSDKEGNFKLHLSPGHANDTIVISSVGYESIRLPVKKSLKNNEFKLKAIVKNMETVTVFNTHQTVGIMSESIGYYRSWAFNRTGGEIGRIFRLPNKKYKVDKVRFKVANLCDTCLLRLRFRKVVNGSPGDEIFSDSISTYVNRVTLQDKIPEFDLTPYDFTFDEDELFVGIEVLGCSNKQNQFCSFSFAGTDRGDYIYKTKADSDWILTEDYAIYLKLFFRY